MTAYDVCVGNAVPRADQARRCCHQRGLARRTVARGLPSQDAPLDEQVVIRELTLDAEGGVVSVSEFALSPKKAPGRTSTSDALKHELERLLATTGDEGIACGENGRRASREELEEWLLLVGRPVFSYRRG